MDQHNNLSSPSSSPNHHNDFTSHSLTNNIINNNNMKTTSGDNISQLSQPNSDISSLSAAATEINLEKYQRLAAEFAKLRSQFIVLKKAVVDEQSKNTELHETLKLRDQTTRRMEQETESLMFRNKQLTKRISVLQNDLEHDASGQKHRSFLFPDSSKNRSSSNASNSSSIPSVDADLFDEINQELKVKMEENERLRELITSMEDKRTEEMQLVERRLKDSETKAQQRTESLSGEIRSLSNAVVKIKSEKNELENKLKDTSLQLKNSTVPIEELKQENVQLKNRLEVFEKRLIAAKQHIRLQQSQSPMHLQPPPTSSLSQPPNELSPGSLLNGIPRSGSFSGVIRSSGSFSRGILRSGSLSINHSGSSNVANLFSTQSQSSKDLSQLVASANNQQTSPSHSSKSYQDILVKQRIIGEFAVKISEIICALSTLHSNASKKISILFALFNNNVNHFYFFDISSIDSQPNEVNPNVPLNRSVYIQTILRKFSDFVKSGYDTHLVHLEEATHQFLSAKIRFYQQQQSDEAINKQRTESTSDLSLIQQEIKQLSGEIVEKFNDYLNYLNKINPYISLCLNYWCKNLQEYDPNNNQLVKLLGLDTSKFDNEEKRESLCQKHEQLAHSVTNLIRIIGQVCNYVKVLLSKSLLNTNYLTVFNHFLHRINALEKSLDETKQLFSSKVALEHDLGITVEKDLLSVDDCILSSMVFFRKSIIDVRLMLEMHYFFFVDNSGGGGGGSNVGSQSTSPLVITGQLIPEEELEEDEDDEPESDEDDSAEENDHTAPVEVARREQATASLPIEPTKSFSSEILENIPTTLRPDSQEFKQLEEQMNRYHQQKVQLEQEKEQWTIESELAQLKLEQEQRKVSELEIRVQSLLSQMANNQQAQSKANVPLNQQQSLNRANSNTNSLTSSSGKSLDANYAELGSISSAASLQSPTLDCFGTVNYPAITDQTDQEIVFNDLANYRNGGSKVVSNSTTTNGVLYSEQAATPLESAQVFSTEYLQQKMTKLINTLQLADSRAASFQQECNAIRARYLQMSKEKSDVESRLADQDQTLMMMQEQYQTTVENYECQLRTMSEHLAELNEKLTSQCDQIDILKYQAQQQSQSGKTSSTASSVAKTFRRSFKKS